MPTLDELKEIRRHVGATSLTVIRQRDGIPVMRLHDELKNVI
jgi:hypothetical protein